MVKKIQESIKVKSKSLLHQFPSGPILPPQSNLFFVSVQDILCS